MTSSTCVPNRIACFFATSGHSGVDRIARHLIPALARRGYRVDLLKVRRHGPELGPDLPGVRVIDLGARHTYACLPALARYLRRERPVVLLSDKDRVNRTALLARTLAGGETRLLFRLGTTVSVDLAHRGAVDRLTQRWSMTYLYQRADRVLVPSLGVADDLARYTRLDRSLIQVVPSPIVSDAVAATPPERPDHRWFRSPAEPLILGVGELSARKDFATLIRAFARLHAERPCRLIIAGRGAQRPALVALAASLGVGADVDLPGFVPDPHPYMAHADLFVSTSRWEGLPVALIEALAMGTPVVATDCPSGPAEALQGGRLGRLVRIGDDRGLAEAMRATLADPPPAAMLREAAVPYRIEASTDSYLSAMGLVREAAGSAGRFRRDHAMADRI